MVKKNTRLGNYTYLGMSMEAHTYTALAFCEGQEQGLVSFQSWNTEMCCSLVLPGARCQKLTIDEGGGPWRDVTV